MKTLLTILLFTTFTTFGQWTYKTISNGFDDPFNKAFTATNNNGWLAMETGDPQIVIEYPDSIAKKMSAVFLKTVTKEDIIKYATDKGLYVDINTLPEKTRKDPKAMSELPLEMTPLIMAKAFL